jgi:hypothetical protein
MPAVFVRSQDPTKGYTTTSTPAPIEAKTGVTSATDEVNAYHIPGDMSLEGTIYANKAIVDTQYALSDMRTKIKNGDTQPTFAAGLVKQMQVIEYQRKKDVAEGVVKQIFGYSANHMKELDNRLTETLPNGLVMLDYRAVGVLNVGATQNNMDEIRRLQMRVEQLEQQRAGVVVLPLATESC